jgi:hypothetical protein
MPTATHIGGAVYAGRAAQGGLQRISLQKAQHDYAWLKQQALALRAFDPALSGAVDTEARALAEAHDACVAWRRQVSNCDPYAVKWPVGSSEVTNTERAQ